MSGKRKNIYKRKDGRWEGRYVKNRTPDGKAVYGYVYAHSWEEVLVKLENAEKKQDFETESSLYSTEQYKLYMIAEEWLCQIRPMIKESTYIKYQNLWKSYIQPDIGDLYATDISQNILESHCRKLLTSGGHKGAGLSPKTVADVMSLIRNIFRFCAKKNIPVLCDAGEVMIRHTVKEMRIFSLEEQKILCRYIYSNQSIQNIGILVSLFTGIRVGELCALKWEDISFSEKTLYIHRTMQRLQAADENAGQSMTRTKIIVTPPKSKHSVRTIPFPEELSKIMQSAQTSATGFFLTGSDKKWIEPRTMQNHFKRLLKCCEVKDANYHALRHTFATRCVEMGFDVKSLSEILGHANITITMNRYVHPSMQLKRANMQRLSELLVL